MKTILTIFIALLTGFGLSAQTDKASREKYYSQSFTLKNLNELVVSNQYGTIDVTQTDSANISVKATIAIIAKNMSKADEMLDFIDIEDDFKEGILSISTKLTKDMSFSTMFKGITISVDYVIAVPQGVKLRLVNNEGNVFVADFQGDLNVDVKNSNFKATKLQGEFKIKQIGGEFNVGNVDFMDGEFKNTDLTLDDAFEVNVNLTGGKSNFKVAEKLNIKSNSGEVKVGEVEKMTGISSGTKFVVSDVGDALKMEMNRGSINVGNIHFNFASVDIKATYSKIGLTFMKDAGYQLDITQNRNLKTDIPSNFKLTEQLTATKNVIRRTGFIGNKDYNAFVNLDIRYGNIYIQ
ncbi:MAG: hypothetical protein LBM07_04070 [Culturomica sp.]|jgi:hypothetical protein|nr:hypothetical protein [Culturomica sp.]